MQKKYLYQMSEFTQIFLIKLRLLRFVAIDSWYWRTIERFIKKKCRFSQKKKILQNALVGNFHNGGFFNSTVLSISFANGNLLLFSQNRIIVTGHNYCTTCCERTPQEETGLDLSNQRPKAI